MATEELREMPDLFKTKLCGAHRAGLCSRGDACEFAHSHHALRSTRAFYKTRLCRFGKACNRGDACRFAHGQAELRADPLTQVWPPAEGNHAVAGKQGAPTAATGGKHGAMPNPRGKRGARQEAPEQGRHRPAALDLAPLQACLPMPELNEDEASVQKQPVNEHEERDAPEAHVQHPEIEDQHREDKGQPRLPVAALPDAAQQAYGAQVPAQPFAAQVPAQPFAAQVPAQQNGGQLGQPAKPMPHAPMLLQGADGALYIAIFPR